VAINGGAAYTTSTAVTLHLTATDDVGVTAYRVANGSDCSTDSYVSVSSTTSLDTTVSFTLSAGDGSKTVCAQYKDAAGNQSATATSSIILDTVPPTTTASCNGAACSSSYYTSAVTFALNPNDATSGVDKTYYTTDGTTPTALSNLYIGGFSITSTTTVKWFSVDKAGNQEAVKSQLVQVDTTKPVITPTVTGTLGTNGWYTSNVTVSWAVSDPESGIASSSGCGATTISSDTSGQTVTCSATNGAGLSNSQSVTIKRDASAPSVSASATSGGAAYTPPAWTNHDVVVTFTCADNGPSGVGSVTGPATKGEGAGQTASGTCTDNAGNSASTSMTQINVDETPPTITAKGYFPDGSAYDGSWTNKDITVKFTCSDALSGIATNACPINQVVSASSASTAGTDVSGSVSDIAGNSASSNTVTVK
jgi:hypothetical protein